MANFFLGSKEEKRIKVGRITTALIPVQSPRKRRREGGRA